MTLIAIGWVGVSCSQVDKEYSGVVSDAVGKTQHVGPRMRDWTGRDRGGALRKAPLEGGKTWGMEKELWGRHWRQKEGAS